MKQEHHSGKIVPQGSLGLTVKTHLSANHILAASLFARWCGEIESENQNQTSLSQDLDIEHRSLAIGTPIEAVAFLETAINELYMAAQDNDPNVFANADPLLPKLMVQLWEELEEKRILTKYQTTLLLAQKPKFSAGEPPLQLTAHLIALRNALVHYKPEWDNQLKAHKSIEDRLGKAFPTNPFAGKNKAFFPSQCLGYGCAAWSVRTAWAFVKEFYSRMELPYWALAHEGRILNI